MPNISFRHLVPHAIKFPIILWLLGGALFSLSQSIHAQDKPKEKKVKLWGYVRNSFTRAGISGVKITLMRTDSTVVDTMTIKHLDEGTPSLDANYTFDIPAQKAKYIILAQHPEYHDCYVNLDIKYIARNTYFGAPSLYMVKKPMEETTHELGEVVVKSTKIKMVVKGDTIVYNADAFNLPQGSMLDALVRQLPGATLNDKGEIYINGKKVDYLMLNGKDFFKGKNQVMLQNLPYYTIQNIKVYNRTTDMSKYIGRDVEQKEYVMDVRLKKVYAQGFMGNVDVGIGTKDRYTAKAFGVYYTDHTRLSLYGNSNNLNDLNYMSESHRGWGSMNSPDGVVRTYLVGTELSLENAEGNRKNTTTAELRWNSQTQEINTASEKFLSTGNTFTRSNSWSNGKAILLDISNTFETFKPFYIWNNTHLTYTHGNLQSKRRNATLSTNPELLGYGKAMLDSFMVRKLSPRDSNAIVNRQESEEERHSNNLNLANLMHVSVKLPWGDNITMVTEFNFMKQMNKMYGINFWDYPQGRIVPDVRNEYTRMPRHAYYYASALSYNIHLNKWSASLDYQYNQQYNYKNSALHRLDWLNEWTENHHPLTYLPSTHDSLLLAQDFKNSYFFNSLARGHKVTPRLSYIQEDEGKQYIYFRLTLDMEHYGERLSYHRKLKDVNLKKHYTFFTPSFFLSTRSINNRHSIDINANRKATHVDLLQTVDVMDDSNPLCITLGNPDLKPTYNTSMRALYRYSRQEKLFHFNTGFSFNITEDALANGFVYHPETGGYTYKPENVNGNWFSDFNIGVGSAIDKKQRWSWENNISNTYIRNIDLTAVEGSHESARNKVNTNNLHESLQLNYQINKLTINLLGDLIWRHSTSKRTNFTTINAFDYSYGAKVNYTFPFNLNVTCDMTVMSRRGYNNTMMDIDAFLFNASIAQTFLKGNLTMRLQTYDLFHQLRNLKYEVNGQGRTETHYKTIPPYVMLHLGYKLHLAPKKH